MLEVKSGVQSPRQSELRRLLGLWRSHTLDQIGEVRAFLGRQRAWYGRMARWGRSHWIYLALPVMFIYGLFTLAGIFIIATWPKPGRISTWCALIGAIVVFISTVTILAISGVSAAVILLGVMVTFLFCFVVVVAVKITRKP